MIGYLEHELLGLGAVFLLYLTVIDRDSVAGRELLAQHPLAQRILNLILEQLK